MTQSHETPASLLACAGVRVNDDRLRSSADRCTRACSVWLHFPAQHISLLLSPELLILSVATHLFFQTPLHHCPLALPQTHYRFLSPFSLAHKPRDASCLCVTLVEFLFLCNYTASFLRAVLHPTAAGFLHASSSPSWCQRLFFGAAVKPNLLFLWTRLDETSRLPGLNPTRFRLWWRP